VPVGASDRIPHRRIIQRIERIDYRRSGGRRRWVATCVDGGERLVLVCVAVVLGDHRCRQSFLEDSHLVHTGTPITKMCPAGRRSGRSQFSERSRKCEAWQSSHVRRHTSSAEQKQMRRRQSAASCVALELKWRGALAIDPDRLVSAVPVLHKREMVPQAIVQIVSGEHALA
jgi:hypothetical protein